MCSDFTRQIEIIKKTVQKFSEAISSGTCQFNIENTLEDQEIRNFVIGEGKVVTNKYQIVLRHKIEWDIYPIEDSEVKKYSWYFFSNLNSHYPEKVYEFKGAFCTWDVLHGDLEVDEKEILDFIKESIEKLQEAQIAYDLKIIDEVKI